MRCILLVTKALWPLNKMRSSDALRCAAIRVTVSSFARGILASRVAARSVAMPGMSRSVAGASVTFAGRNGPPIRRATAPPPLSRAVMRNRAAGGPGVSGARGGAGRRPPPPPIGGRFHVHAELLLARRVCDERALLRVDPYGDSEERREAPTELVERVAVDHVFEADPAVEEQVVDADVRRLRGHGVTCGARTRAPPTHDARSVCTSVLIPSWRAAIGRSWSDGTPIILAIWCSPSSLAHVWCKRPKNVSRTP